jgi:outer membrane protein OmpA-like peptidoglycan-associated protein
MKNMWRFYLFLILVGQANATELSIPKTAAQISEALGKPKRAPIDDQFEEKSLSGEDKGFNDITNDLPVNLPKVGALIHFAVDSDRIQADSYPLLQEYAIALKGDLKTAVILIAGHTDFRGSANYNADLSLRRAKAVQDFLVKKHGVSQARLLVRGYGKENPVSTNDSEAEQALNRRVEFIRVE